MNISVEELTKWIIQNAFNIEAQDGTKYSVIDVEDLNDMLTKFNCVNFADGEARCEKQCKYCERVKGF
jgi:hypothetical protein